MQGNIVAELNDRDERRAAQWFDTTWTGPHGNYTRATAGYVETPFSAGLEASWRYMRRDTVGTSGSNMRMSLGIFVPNLTKYITDTSGKHADKVLNSANGKHQFPSMPTISTKLWKQVQAFDSMRLALSYVEGSKATQELWDHEIYWFWPADAELSKEARAALDERSITDKISLYHAGGRSIGAARSNIGSVVMPTARLLEYLQDKHKFVLNVDTMRDMEGHLRPLRELYMDLFLDPVGWNTSHPEKTVDAILDLLEAFHRWS